MIEEAKYSVNWFRTLPAAQQQNILLALTNEELTFLQYDWRFWAREKQLAPAGDWFIWAIEAGRGFGKTRTGAEWVRDCITSGLYGRLALVAPTAADVRDTMVEGHSGILSCSPPDMYPSYKPSKRSLTWPNGAKALLYSADEPDRLRGPNFEAAWVDEVAAWRHPLAWDMLLLGVRIGNRPRICATYTPKALPHIIAIRKRKDTVLVKGTTYENEANLAPDFFRQIVSQYEGTRLGRQEIYAELLEDVEGALWSQKMIDASRVTRTPSFLRVVVGVDPASGPGETGIVVAALGNDVHGYVLEDATIHGSPDVWAKAVVTAYNKFMADRIIYETNQGGLMVAHTIRTVDENVPLKGVNASRNKQARAEPIVALYEQKRIHHVGMFGDMESQMCTWVPNEGMPSPDRLDAMVWAFTELLLGEAEPVVQLW